MSSFLDWITLNPWAVALCAVAVAVAGYAVTRPAALRGAASDDPAAWLAFCMALYADTRASRDDAHADADSSEAGGDGGD